jgi:RNase H-fold protein (predicted Holliday junction resolvase)
MIHPSSFMERDSHPESIYELLEVKVDRLSSVCRPLHSFRASVSLTHVLPIATIVEESAETVNYALGLPTTSRGRSSARTSKNKEFTKFVERVLDTAEVSITDILVTLVYMRRARAHLSIETEEWALHRVFLGALVLAHKVSLKQLLFVITGICI